MLKTDRNTAFDESPSVHIFGTPEIAEMIEDSRSIYIFHMYEFIPLQYLIDLEFFSIFIPQFLKFLVR